MIKTVIIDDHELSRYGIKMLLSAAPDIEICGEAQTASEGLKIIDIHKPHIALVNSTLANGAGVEVTRQIKQEASNTKVVIFNAQATEVCVREAFVAGANSYCTTIDISENYLTFTTTAFEEMKVKCKDTQIIRYNQC
ncbi:two component transcriptional regulator, LuxR family protein [Sphaerospermopsis reniformis]|uniref:Two component transcriptional regulator, LuxR family protein n=1 Tax=Sphaerospermopsis reniformis TaxID=531300 RepID=A0A480A3X4_9CYAN|nr:response regulator transcription factor [Sphaerospermopsis reniformis]GCL39212.1 two component transcriptional regulator, LuxR family protein [Sphaerospermopsis reniformis]